MGILDAPFVPSRRTQESLRTQNSLAMRPWRTLYANAAVAAVDMLFIGDSRFEGQNAVTTVENRAMSLIRDQVRTARGVTGGRGYIPSWYAFSAPTGQNPTTSGTVTQQSNFGLGKRNVSISTSTANAITFSFTGTSFDLIYAKATSTGHMGISIDGGAITDVDTVGALTADGSKWNSGALSAGAHTVAVSWRSGGQVLIDGLMAYNGDESTGIRLWDGSHFGFRAASFAPFGTGSWNNIISSIPNLGLVVIATMTNDEIAVSSAQYATDLQALIAAVKAKASATVPPAIVLVADWERGDATAKIEPHANYVSQIYNVVAADPTLAVIDLTRRMVVGSADNYGTYNADKVHESGIGHRMKADVITDFLTRAV